MKYKKRQTTPRTKSEAVIIMTLLKTFKLSPFFILMAKPSTISKTENTEIPSHSPMELPKSLNRETRGTLVMEVQDLGQKEK